MSIHGEFTTYNSEIGNIYDELGNIKFEFETVLSDIGGYWKGLAADAFTIKLNMPGS